MPAILVHIASKQEVLQAHYMWSKQLPRLPGQITGTMTTWVEGPPVAGPDGKLEWVQFPFADADFLAFLKEQSVTFVEI